MKTGPALMITSFSGFLSFICTYFLHLTMDNTEQYIAIISVVLLDGIFGIIAGAKREGFKTFKALKILQTLKVHRN